MDTMKKTYVCSLCGKTNVQVKMWINPNTNINLGEWVTHESDEDECWCQNCQQHVKIVVV